MRERGTQWGFKWRWGSNLVSSRWKGWSLMASTSVFVRLRDIVFGQRKQSTSSIGIRGINNGLTWSINNSSVNSMTILIPSV